MLYNSLGAQKLFWAQLHTGPRDGVSDECRLI